MRAFVLALCCLAPLSATAQSLSAAAVDDIAKFPFVDVRAYGAMGDGVNDDTPAIQAAIDSLHDYPLAYPVTATSRGGIVFFPPGKYRVTNTIKITSVVQLRGGGAGSELIWDWGGPGPSGTNENLVVDISGEANVYLALQGLFDMKIRHKDATSNCSRTGTDPRPDASEVSMGIRVRSPNAPVLGHAGDPYTPGGKQVSLERLQVCGFGTGVVLTDNTLDGSMKDVEVYYNNTGLLVESAWQWVYSNLKAHGNRTGIKISGGWTNFFYGGLVQSSLDEGVTVDSCYSCALDGFHFENNPTSVHFTGQGVVKNFTLARSLMAGNIRITESPTVCNNDQLLFESLRVDSSPAGKIVLEDAGKQCPIHLNMLGVSLELVTARPLSVLTSFNEGFKVYNTGTMDISDTLSTPTVGSTIDMRLFTPMTGKWIPSGADADYRAKVSAVSQSTSDGTGALAFYTNNAGTLGERMRIQPTGNVSIGSALSNNARLDVRTGGVNAKALDLISTEPAAAGNSVDLRFFLPSAGGTYPTGPEYEYKAKISAINANVGNYQTDLAFYTNGWVSAGTLDERMRIKWNGNVGIGTSSPTQALEVNGALRLNPTTAGPSCTDSSRGTFWFNQSPNGVRDEVYVCMREADGSYKWHVLAYQ